MNYKKLPKHDEVEQIGDFQLVKVTAENRDSIIEACLKMYENEPCRICGELITDARQAVYAGYSGKARSAHKTCWNKNTPKHLWAYPVDDID